jgi:hypothetical protein
VGVGGLVVGYVRDSGPRWDGYGGVCMYVGMYVARYKQASKQASFTLDFRLLLLSVSFPSVLDLQLRQGFNGHVCQGAGWKDDRVLGRDDKWIRGAMPALWSVEENTYRSLGPGRAGRVDGIPPPLAADPRSVPIIPYVGWAD